MDDFLKLVDALRTRGAIKIQTPECLVEFASPHIPITMESPAPKDFVPDVKPEDLDKLMYTETSRL